MGDSVDSGIVAEYERLLALEQDRRRKREKLEALLLTIADALDVRVVFTRMSAQIQDVIPHVTVSLALLTPDRGGVKIHVASNYEVGDLPEYRFTTEGEAIRSSWRAFITYDSTVVAEGVLRVRTTPEGEEPAFVDLHPGPVWTRIVTRFGVRAVLRVPVRIKDQPIGAISFGADRPFAYGDDDVILATRIADHIALALAHEQLAEEGRRAAQAQERANQLERRVQTLVEEVERRGGHRALGDSASWKQALVHATKVAKTDTTVLITGESGTGKEVVARFIHRGSPRAHGPFVALNCAALPEQLLEAELFGYERGAFTGAHASRAGRIEQASGGVLFLDEVGEMTPAVQAKFLRVLQEREFLRLGGTRMIQADVRVVAATNRDLREAVARGEFRADLYYRVNVFDIPIAPLRQRRDDIPVIAARFLHEFADAPGGRRVELSPDALEALLTYDWPGNVRELRNVLERAAIVCENGVILPRDLSLWPVPAAVGDSTDLDVIERRTIERVMREAEGNKAKAAGLLGITRTQLYGRLRKYGLL
jgi:transcriptional regulator with GAF, ATPase, and Fis domain